MKQFGDIARNNGTGAFAMRVLISDGPLGVSWQHASETCEFLGDVFALRHAKAGADYTDARHSIIYLVNELLENAIKFRVPGAIRVDCSLQDGNFELTVSNDTAPEVARSANRAMPNAKAISASAEGSVKPVQAASAPSQPARCMPSAMPTWLLAGPGRNWHSATRSE